eukprot:m.71857 g.71857  ORF g.71857 m.71857 type:complete len:119 (-) comp12281_c0_seq2:1714-2070(-)
MAGRDETCLSKVFGGEVGCARVQVARSSLPQTLASVSEVSTTYSRLLLETTKHPTAVVYSRRGQESVCGTVKRLVNVREFSCKTKETIMNKLNTFHNVKLYRDQLCKILLLLYSNLTL